MPTLDFDAPLGLSHTSVMPRALVTGITGQDGQYLAELLHTKGYDVFGLVKGQNNPRTILLQEEFPFVEVVGGDLADLASLVAALEYTQPDEVYNLGAISFVALSFRQAELTANVTGLGVLRMLESIRMVGGVDNPIRFYQASSSEMFGKVRQTPQNEETPFYPRSPYGVAKVFGHDITVNYRDSYDLFACSGILFNHESVPGNTPIVVRMNSYIDILPIQALIPHAREGQDGARVSFPGGNLEVWDGSEWTLCTGRTAYWHDGESVEVHGRGGIVECTPDHLVFTPDGESPAGTLDEGGQCILASQPSSGFSTTMSREEAWLLGILTAEGHVSEKGVGCIVCGDSAVLAEAAACWERVTAGSAVKTTPVRSAFSQRETPRLQLSGAPAYLRLIRSELYTADGHKRVTKRILNAEPEIQTEFLAAYNLGDGLRAGHGVDIFKSFRTTSPVLAAGLVYLARTTLGRRVSVYLQPGALGGGSSYLINLSSSLTPDNLGAHLRKPQEEIRKVERRPYQGWMYDLATESGRFAAGVGMVVVHNSPRRGMEFVTRKITNAVARIKLGLQSELTLGSIEPQRDWGFAGDYVEAMWLMLQQDEPEDFVVATGETHSVREFVELAFRAAGIDDWTSYVRQDERFMRPSEVDLLVGDAGKARRLLGWTPTMAFPELVETMVEHDLELEQRRERNRRR